MLIKAKIAGIVLIIVGALPFLLKLEIFSSIFDKYNFLSFILPGGFGYQLLIVLIGIWLFWKLKPIF
jgi:hypothetical protein